jgi:hypothetical protein
MRSHRTRTCALSTVLLLLAAAAPGAAQHAHAPHAQRHTGLQVPDPMRIEHEAIHARLEAATRAPGAVGAAARELARLLAPHFERENQIALPPLALLEPLARGDVIAAEAAAHALAMTDSLAVELPRMLEEHVRIDAAARTLEQVARTHGDAAVADLAHGLQLHARMEQAIHYPAALLVGAALRQRGR